MSVSSIDDLLTSTSQPVQESNVENDNDSQLQNSSSPDYGVDDDGDASTPHESSSNEKTLSDNDDVELHEVEDEYGNKTENLSKSMQKRLERQAESMRR